MRQYALSRATEITAEANDRVISIFARVAVLRFNDSAGHGRGSTLFENAVLPFVVARTLAARSVCTDSKSRTVRDVVALFDDTVESKARANRNYGVPFKIAR